MAWSILTRCSVYSVSQYHAKAATKINFSKKEKKKIIFLFNTVEQATGALTVVEAASKPQSVNPEYFPGKLKHSSHLSRIAGLCNPTRWVQGLPVPPHTRVGKPPSLQHSCTPGISSRYCLPANFDLSAQSRPACRLFALSWVEEHRTGLFVS